MPNSEFHFDSIGRKISPGDILFNKGQLHLVMSLTKKMIRTHKIWWFEVNTFNRTGEPPIINGEGYITEPLLCVNLGMKAKIISPLSTVHGDKIVVEYTDPMTDRFIKIAVPEEMEKYYQ